MARTYAVPDKRIINVDETALLLLPVKSQGWSRCGEKSAQVVAGKACFTASLIVAKEGEHVYTQIIFKGETPAVAPTLPADYLPS